ncbi:MAG TPA: tripartite tricarboxylate transporter substrate binding protein [Alphaproteobacteria bacterium]|nr:tripartite tricarboxylate transporter substrate binding protein [Alphaproteobacteria bacterium]
MKWVRLGFYGMAATLSLAAAPALALDYPTRPVHVICPYPPGGTADIVARLVAQAITESTGQSAVVEDRAGAGGNIGAEVVAKAEPDGYTLLASPPGPLATNISLYKTLPYDSRTAFAPISIVAQSASVLVARLDAPYHSVAELVAYAKANPKKVNYASQGAGTTSHLTAAMMSEAAHIQMVHVPYKGSAPADADLIGGHVDILWDNIGSTMSYIRAKQMQTLAVGSRARAPELPDVPTMLELGYPDFVSVAWFAAAAPAHTPSEIVDKIAKAIATYVHKPDVVERLKAIGVEPVGDTPQEMAKFVHEETDRWAKVIKAEGIQLE